MQDNNNNYNLDGTFTTKETALAAYLYTEGFELIDVIVNKFEPSIFLFENSSQLQVQAKGFRLHQVMVNAANYYEAYRKCLVMVKHGKI